MIRKASPVERPRPFRCQDLAAFELLGRPIWVFDIDRKAMLWANTLAMELWNAESQTDLLHRDFASDMSEATSRRLAEYRRRFQDGERFSEQVRRA